MLFLLVLFALLLKLWGMIAVFHAVGSWVGDSVRSKRQATAQHAATVGPPAIWGPPSLLPFVGDLDLDRGHP